jgi:hypothetical protein
MAEQLTAEVIHVVSPDDREEYDLDTTVASLAESRYLLVCRDGGAPSWVERIVAFLRRDPIEPVTLIADEGVAVGTELTARVEETAVSGVYEISKIETK